MYNKTLLENIICKNTSDVISRWRKVRNIPPAGIYLYLYPTPSPISPPTSPTISTPTPTTTTTTISTPTPTSTSRKWRYYCLLLYLETVTMVNHSSLIINCEVDTLWSKSALEVGTLVPSSQN